VCVIQSCHRSAHPSLTMIWMACFEKPSSRSSEGLCRPKLQVRSTRLHATFSGAQASQGHNGTIAQPSSLGASATTPASQQHNSHAAGGNLPPLATHAADHISPDQKLSPKSNTHDIAPRSSTFMSEGLHGAKRSAWDDLADYVDAQGDGSQPACKRSKVSSNGARTPGSPPPQPNTSATP
jgi:hypothetical protein